MSQYYLLLNGAQVGPFTIPQLRAMWSSGAITINTPYWQENMKDWSTLGAIAGTLDPKPYQQSSYLPSPEPTKQKESQDNCPTAMIQTANTSFVISVLLTFSVFLAIFAWIPWLISSILIVVLFCNNHPDAHKAATRLVYWNFSVFLIIVCIAILVWLYRVVPSDFF